MASWMGSNRIVNIGWRPKPGCALNFNIDGIKVVDLPAIKRKSLMKAKFKAAGVETAPGIVIQSAEQACKFAEENWLPGHCQA